MEKKFAIIDLGSNSVRMIIMKIYKDGSYKMIEQEKEMVRLSEGMGKELTLKPRAIERTLYTLKLFKKLLEAHKVDKVIAVATAAVRKARNKQDFLAKAKEVTGLDFNIISGEEEAYYGYLGVINTIDISSCVIIDIGGASTEVVWVADKKIKECISLPYGAVVLTETFLKKDPIPTADLKKLENFLFKRFNDIPWFQEVKKLPIIGLGGTIRTLAKIDKKKNKYPLERLHNYRLTLEKAASICDQVITSTVTERKKIPGLNKSRADIIAGGLAVIKVLKDLSEAEELIISGNGLREGVFFRNYLNELGYTEGIVEDILKHSLENVLKNYDANLKHCYHVQKLALSLFDQTKDMHGFGAEERKLLAVSSLLHDIGIYVDYYNHHKHGFYLVQNAKINGLKNKELLMCAFIVAMHRDVDFKKGWKTYSLLIDKQDYEVIKKLSLFVRIAENLDRNEFESINNLDCYISKNRLEIKLLTNNTPELEIGAAMRSEKDFYKLFKKNLVINIYNQHSA